MSAFKFLGTFLQGALFGGTYDDVAFEVRVLKGEISRLHERIDRELAELRDRIDRLEGKPGAGKGRSRLSVMSSAAAADLGSGSGGMKAAPAPAAAEGPATAGPEHRTTTASSGTAAALASETPAWTKEMRLKDAWLLHPDAPRVFARHHLPACPDCALSETESLAEGIAGHGLDVDAFVRDLNQLASS
jgi:hybrid cluster-associated redox disulfide protein